MKQSIARSAMRFQERLTKMRRNITSAPPPPSSLLDLPAEIRVLIWQHVFEKTTLTNKIRKVRHEKPATEKSAAKTTTKKTWTLRLVPAASLLFTCRTIYNEALPLFWAVAVVRMPRYEYLIKPLVPGPSWQAHSQLRYLHVDCEANSWSLRRGASVRNSMTEAPKLKTDKLKWIKITVKPYRMDGEPGSLWRHVEHLRFKIPSVETFVLDLDVQSDEIPDDLAFKACGRRMGWNVRFTGLEQYAQQEWNDETPYDESHWRFRFELRTSEHQLVKSPSVLH